MFQHRFEANLRARLVGVDDGRFTFRTSTTRSTPRTLLVAVLLEGTRILAVRIGKITVDGMDATKVLSRLLKALKFDAIFLSGISFAGFNLIDPYKIWRMCGRPIIVVCGSQPDNRSVKKALRRHFGDWRTRWAIVQKLGAIHQMRSSKAEPPIFFEVVGTSVVMARKWIRDSARLGRLPEPVRVAGLVAKGLSA